MLDLIEKHREQIVAICARRGVKRLELFGSAARGGFDPATSDVDFFVEFLSYDSPDIVEQWFGLQEDLERLLGHGVDLTSVRMARNPHFLSTANRDKIELYAA